MTTKKVIVIGAGIIGLSTAYYLQERGVEVEVIDAGDGTDNCSYGNAGYISPSHLIPLASPGIINQGLKWMMNPESPFYIKPRLSLELFKWGLLFKQASTHSRVNAAVPVLEKLMIKSKALYEEIIQNESIEAGYNNSGLLMICKTKTTLEHEIELVRLCQKFGLDAEVISKAETEKLQPEVKYNMNGAVYFGCDAWLSPDAFMNALKKQLVTKSVKLTYKTKLQKIRHENNRIEELITSKGIFSADEYIITAGSWTSILAKQVNLKIPLQAGKGYSLTIEKPPVSPRIPAILTEGRLATTPMLNGLRFAGTMEISGYQQNISKNRVDGIIKTIKDFMPDFREFDFSEIEVWSGLRPCSPDGLPYIGRTNRIKNLLIGTGHAMLGMTLGPVTGQILADSVVGEANFDSPLLAVDRYA